MNEQRASTSNPHESVSSTPDEGTEREITAEQEVVEESYGGKAPPYGPRELGRAGSGTAVVQSAPDTTHLHDIALASFGQGGAELVIGNDDRVQVANTADHPWRMNASLRITAADNSAWIGTAWFIGPRTLATAAHCVFIHAPGTPRHGWARSIQVMPGRSVSALPYGSVTSMDFRAVSGWTESDTPHQKYDYAAIVLPTDLGTTTGWYGFGVYSDDDLRNSTVGVSGYPGDKPVGTQWHHGRQVVSVDSSKVYYDLDTAGGQSGSAVYRVVDDKYIGVAIHAYGGATTNNGTRIVQAVYDNLTAWKS